MATTIDQELQAYMSELNQAQKISLLNVIKTFLSPSGKGTAIGISQYNEEIASSESEFEKGEAVSQEEVKNISKNWLGD